MRVREIWATRELHGWNDEKSTGNILSTFKYIFFLPLRLHDLNAQKLIMIFNLFNPLTAKHEISRVKKNYLMPITTKKMMSEHCKGEKSRKKKARYERKKPTWSIF